MSVTSEASMAARTGRVSSGHPRTRRIYRIFLGHQDGGRVGKREICRPESMVVRKSVTCRVDPERSKMLEKSSDCQCRRCAWTPAY